MRNPEEFTRDNYEDFENPMPRMNPQDQEMVRVPRSLLNAMAWMSQRLAANSEDMDEA
ncbi:MAG: hypothetical protein HQ553_09450 [Chloroflexi bacterium]|nr:hypothetical protein [Chloroflexota bacterium]